MGTMVLNDTLNHLHMWLIHDLIISNLCWQVIETTWLHFSCVMKVSLPYTIHTKVVQGIIIETNVKLIF